MSLHFHHISNGWPPTLFVFFLEGFVIYFESQSCRKRSKDIEMKLFYVLVHSSDVHNGQRWVRLEPGWSQGLHQSSHVTLARAPGPSFLPSQMC